MDAVLDNSMNSGGPEDPVQSAAHQIVVLDHVRAGLVTGMQLKRFIFIL